MDDKNLESTKFLIYLQKGYNSIKEEIANNTLTVSGINAWLNHLPIKSSNNGEDWNDEVYKLSTEIRKTLQEYLSKLK